MLYEGGGEYVGRHNEVRRSEQREERSDDRSDDRILHSTITNYPSRARFAPHLSITIRTHQLPSQGATLFQFYNAGNYCDVAAVENGVDSYMSILPDMDERWSGLTFVTSAHSEKKEGEAERRATA